MTATVHQLPAGDRALRKKIWDAIEKHIEAQATDGIGAEGVYSEIVAEHQWSYVQRFARLAALKAVETMP